MRSVRRLGGKAVSVCAVLLTAYPPTRLAAQWSPEDRVLLTDFSRVTAVASSPFVVFGATTGGLIMYDRGARTWRPPVTVVDGYPEAPVRVALADVTGNAVWLGTRDGWARYDADIRMWQQGPVPGGVLDLLIDSQDPASGIFVRSGVGWEFLPRGGTIPGPVDPTRPLPPPERRVRPLDPATALNLAPVADAMRAFILTDPRLRTHQFTAAARTPDQSDFFFGTTGLGIIRIDPVTGEWEALPFGLLAPAAGALALGVDGIWVAANARVGERRGLTWVSDDVATTRVAEGAGTLGLQFTAGRRMLALRRALWVATERGVLRYVPDSNAFTMIDRGLPVSDVLSLAPAPDGVWAGTTRGLAHVGDDGTVTRIAADFIQPALALLAVRESLWVGTAAGIGVLGPGAREIVVPPEIAAQPTLRGGAIVALARLGETLVVAMQDQLAWRTGGSWTVERARGDLGRLTTLTVDGSGVWVGGELGLAHWNPGRAIARVLRVPHDLPAAVRDVAVDATWLWVATDRGVVRFRRAAAIDR